MSGPIVTPRRRGPKQIWPGRFIQQVKCEHIGDGEPRQTADLVGDEGAVHAAGRKVTLVHPFDVRLLVVRADLLQIAGLS